MSIHVRRSGSTRSWLVIVALAIFVAVALSTGMFGLRAGGP